MTEGAWLVMSQGPQPGQTFMLDRDWITVGRDPTNEIVINDPQVSRQHSRITRQGKTTVIEDLGSTNGTFANGMRLTGPHVLATGDVIGLGDGVKLTYYEVGIAADVTAHSGSDGRSTGQEQGVDVGGVWPHGIGTDPGLPGGAGARLSTGAPAHLLRALKVAGLSVLDCSEGKRYLSLVGIYPQGFFVVHSPLSPIC
jgi:hypothetical protein